MEKSSEYKYYSFDPENSILYHEVNDENFGNKELFIISLSYFVTLIEKNKPKRIIVKICKKPGFYEYELREFMQKTILKSIMDAGIRKVAFFVSDEKYFSDLKINEKDDPVMVRFFLDLELAKQWVLS
jgi:hypothetical protein